MFIIPFTTVCPYALVNIVNVCCVYEYIHAYAHTDINFIGMSLGVTRSFKTNVRHYHLLATDCYMTGKVSEALRSCK